MDIFFQDPSEIPLPPDEVRIRKLSASPWPDGRRVKVVLEVDPFQKRPNADVFIRNALGDQVAEVSLIEPMTRKLEFTMHLRRAQPGRRIYDRGGSRITPTLSLSPRTLKASQEELKLPELTLVDRASASFTVVPGGDEADAPA